MMHHVDLKIRQHGIHRASRRRGGMAARRSCAGLDWTRARGFLSAAEGCYSDRPVLAFPAMHCVKWKLLRLNNNNALAARITREHALVIMPRLRKGREP